MVTFAAPNSATTLVPEGTVPPQALVESQEPGLEAAELQMNLPGGGGGGGAWQLPPPWSWS